MSGVLRWVHPGTTRSELRDPAWGYLDGMSNCFHSCAQRRNRFRVNSLCAKVVGSRTAPAASAQTPKAAVTARTVFSRRSGMGPVRLPSASMLMVMV